MILNSSFDRDLRRPRAREVDGILRFRGHHPRQDGLDHEHQDDQTHRVPIDIGIRIPLLLLHGHHIQIVLHSGQLGIGLLLLLQKLTHQAIPSEKGEIEVTQRPFGVFKTSASTSFFPRAKSIVLDIANLFFLEFLGGFFGDFVLSNRTIFF